jgi:hypothetical protein
MPRLTIDECNKQIVRDPLSLTEIDTDQIRRGDFVLLNDLKECRNLKIFTFIEGGEFVRCGYTIKPNNLNLQFCTKLTHLTITLFHQYTFDTIDLTNCVQLTHLSIFIPYREINIKNINLTNCINLTHFEFNGEMSIRDYSSMPDLSKCVKLQYINCCHASGQKLDINLNPILFPDIIECNGKLHSNLILRLKKFEDSSSRLIESKFIKLEKENKLLKIKDDENKKILQQHESLLTLITAKFNKLEEENREMRKIIDELRPVSYTHLTLPTID